MSRPHPAFAPPAGVMTGLGRGGGMRGPRHGFDGAAGAAGLEHAASPVTAASVRRCGARRVTWPAKPATVRSYTDADVLGCAKTLIPLLSEITWPGDLGGFSSGGSARPVRSRLQRRRHSVDPRDRVRAG